MARGYKIVNLTSDEAYAINAGQTITSNEFWRLGSDNRLPEAIALLNRRSPIHRGILNAKTLYISGRGFSYNENNKNLDAIVKSCNNKNEHLKNVLKKVIFDKQSQGNGWIEIVTDSKKSFVNIFHQDTLKCRLSKDKKQALLYHDWGKYTDLNKDKLKKVDIYPSFSDYQNTGYLHSMIHLKSHEPGFENYGVIEWLAGLSVSAISYKTDKWNLSRLDNSFTSSGVLVIDGEFESDNDAEEFRDDVNNEFVGEGKQGKILTITKTKGDGTENGSKFVPIVSNYEGDWKGLNDHAITELIVAHGWFRSLTSLPDNTGFDTKRILNEYAIALNTVILDEQEFYLNEIRNVLESFKIDTTDLKFINKAPLIEKPEYMFVWEARQVDGLPFDENDPKQQITLAELKKSNPNGTSN